MPSAPPSPARPRAASASGPVAASVRGQRSEGFALVLVLIFTILIYVLVTELVVTARMARLTGENDALLARMHSHMAYTLTQIEDQLRDDLAAEAGAGGGLPGLGGAGGGQGEGGNLGGLGYGGGGGAGGRGGGPGGGPGGEPEEDPAAICDSSRDAWFEPAGYSDDDLTTYVWVEDENRKFNILTLVSEDREFALESRQRFARLIDHLREDSEYDLSAADGEGLAEEIIDWIEGGSRHEEMPRPRLETDELTDLTPPLSLDELLMLPSVDEELFFDKVLDGRVILGLEAVLTVHTALRVEPVEPDPDDPQLPLENEELGPPPVLGDGIRVNVNTAPRAVLRCLVAEYDMPDSVIEAILRYRNEEEEQQELSAQGGGGLDGGYGGYYDDLRLGSETAKKVFTTPEDLEEVPEFANLANPDAKQQFLDAITTESHVFSVHMASLHKRNEEQRNFVLRRARSILVRLEEGEGASLYPIVLLEERHGLRVMSEDFPEEFDPYSFSYELDQLDRFAAEERRWNPFFVEFYVPSDEEP